MARLVRYLILTGVVFAAACTDDEIDPHATIVKRGRIESPASPPTFEIPATATAGQTVPMELTTFGDSCFHAERTEVRQDGNDWIVTPYDRSPRDIGCDDSLWSISHEFAITFASAGEVVVVIDGADYADVRKRITATISVQ